MQKLPFASTGSLPEQHGAQAVFSRRARLLFRLKCGAAGLCLAGAFFCLWMSAGMPFPLSGPGVASAESSPADSEKHIFEAERIALRKMLLQASVDSAALSIAGALENVTDTEARRAVLARALDSLTFDLGAPVYFTAWEQTRLLHSPLTPDTEDMDFADALDSRGVPFVRALSDCLENGGGFTQVLLPRHNFDKAGAGRSSADAALAPETHGGPVAMGQAVISPESISLAVSPLYMSPAAPAASDMEEVQIIYTRPIPNSSWHISAFMAASGEDVQSPSRVFSNTPDDVSNSGQPIHVWNSSLLEDKDAAVAADFGLRKGLCVSGVSLLGLAGILIVPRRREESGLIQE